MKIRLRKKQQKFQRLLAVKEDTSIGINIEQRKEYSCIYQIILLILIYYIYEKKIPKTNEEMVVIHINKVH